MRCALAVYTVSLGSAPYTYRVYNKCINSGTDILKYTVRPDTGAVK